MKSGLPWNLSGVDKETREAVIEAARLSGLTVGEWLNQVLGGNFAEPDLGQQTPQEDDVGEIAHSIERLTQRLGAMDEGARSSITALPDRLDEIEHHISRLSSIRNDGTERTRSLRGIALMVKDLARDADNADERARTMVEGLRVRASGAATPRPQTISHVNEAIADLEQRLAEMRSRVAPAVQPIVNRSAKLDDIRQRLQSLLAETEAAPPPPPKPAAAPQAVVIDAALRALEDRIDDAKAKFEARMAAQAAEPPQPPAATAEQIDRLEQQIADIGAQLAASEAERKKPRKEAELASAIREISSHQRAIDDRAETLAMRRDQKALSAAMAALRADLSGLTDQVSAISRVGAEQHGAFFEVAQRIDTMAAEQPLDRSLLAAIRNDLETMRGMIEGTARQSAFGAIDARHDNIAAQLSDVIRSMPDKTKLDQLGEEVAALRDSLESDDSPKAIQRLEMRVSELGRAIEAVLNSRQAREPDPAVERLESRMQDIAARLESLRDTGAHTAAIHTVEQRLDGRLNEIADRLGGLMNTTPQTIETVERRLEGRLEDIATQLGGLANTTPQTIETVERRLEGRLEDIATQIGGLANSTPQSIQTIEQRLEGRMEDIAARLGGMFDSATRPQTEAIASAQRQLEGRLEEIVSRLGGMFDTAPQKAAIEHVHERLAAITDRIDKLNASQREPSAALDAIKSEIGSLRQEVATKEAPTPVLSTDHLERQIRDLAHQLEAVTENKGGAKALADLESQVARLAGELELTRPRMAALGQVEARLDRMQGLLADSAQESIAGARAEARKAVDELSAMVSGNAIDAELVRGLMRDLDSLRTASGGSSEQTRAKLESVSQTVSQVVDRLSRLETEAAPVAVKASVQAAIETPAEAAAPAQPSFRTELLERMRTPAARGDRKEAAPPAASVFAPPPVAAEKPAGKEPPRAAPIVRQAPIVQTDKRAADRRADFIAAARRAAQAVAEEAAAIEVPAASSAAEGEGAEASAETKPGAFQRISQAIRSRKRPLLLAAAAIVLAIGAMQAYGKLSVLTRHGGLMAAATTTTAKPAPAVVVIAPASQSAKPAVMTPGETADTEPPPRDIIAEAEKARAGATATPAQAAIAPPAAPDATLAFAEPAGVDGHFTSSVAAPAPDAFNGSTSTTTAMIPAATEAAPPLPAAAANPIVLASANADVNAPMNIAPAVPDQPISVAGLDPSLGTSKLLSAAANGDPSAEFEIATRYADGSLVKKDLAKAADWYAKAADGGVAVAQYRLGSLYERGQGVAKDLTKAVDWYQRAADQGNVNAMHNLAVLMSEGADSGPDHDKALQWFLAAANYGVRDSQYNLGVIYARGLGVTQDLAESYKWFAVAAAQGDTDAAQRRDEVAKAMQPDDLAKARAAFTAWHVKAPIAEANGVATPPGGWDGPGDGISDADRTALVAKIQTLLAEAGYDPGPADGVAGPKTVDAVKAYQRKAGVPETGVLDKTLMAALTE